MDLKQYGDFIKGKRVSVIGIGVSNIPLIRFLTERGACVTAHDRKSREDLGDAVQSLENCGARLALGEDYLKSIPSDTDIIFKTPGLRADTPELAAAQKSGAVLTSEMELFFELCPAKIIAVTGSDGKTTTTTLISEMLKKQGFNCFVGGNIGRPLIGDVDKMRAEDIAVLELSSFQLHTMKHSPHVAVVTNVTPNHLDWHKDFDEYIEAKKNIFLNQAENGVVVLNYDNDITRSFAENANRTMFFSRRSDVKTGVFVKDGTVMFSSGEGKDEPILKVSDIKIPGSHNVENYMAAIAAVYPTVSKENIEFVAKNFGGVPHRIELVRELDGVRYYNDSIASSPARTTAGLLSFDKKVVLIAGGYDKKIPFEDFGEVVNDHVKKLILVGNTSEKIEKAVKNAKNFDGLPIYRETDFEDAVMRARECAECGDTVILSPACASFDLFKNFEERGNAFKNIVLNFE